MGKKYEVDENFFINWRPEMAYVLGYFYADGSMEDASYIRGKYIRVSSVDKHTIFKIKNWLKSKHKIVIIRQQQGYKRKTRYLLRIGSHALYQHLINFGLHPNKSLTIRFPTIPKKFLADFVRGYFDGDGCVYLYRGKGKKQKLIIKKLSVIFTSGSLRFLKNLCGVLRKELHLKQSRVYKSKRSFQLRYSTDDSVKLFKFLYKNLRPELRLERKFDVFRNYFTLRKIRVDSKVRAILK